jgi:membrane-associated protease RseP (regulator of RpoE activity)
MNWKSGGWRVWFAALLPFLGAVQVVGQEEAQQTTQTVTVVVSDDGGKSEKALDQIRNQLKNSGLPEESQKKILAQVEEALAHASAATAEVTKAGKAAANAAKEAAEQLGKSLPANKMMPSIQLNMEDLQNRIEGKLKGRLQLGGPQFQLGVGTGPSYRIGISLAQKQQEDDDDDEDEDDDEDDEDDDEQVEGMVVEQVMDDSPASKAGIEPGDVIVSVNGKGLRDFTQLQRVVREAGESDKALVLTLRRDGKDKKIKIKPVKTEESDVSVMEMELLPQQGVFLNGLPLSSFGATDASCSEDLKKEIAELRDEIGELKKMVKKLLEK